MAAGNRNRGKRRKPIGVWMLLSNGPWLFDRHRTLDSALRTARSLRMTGPVDRPRLPQKAVWIAPVE
jgi:hypothetical protein